MKHCFKKNCCIIETEIYISSAFLHDENQFFLLFYAFFLKTSLVLIVFFVPLHTKNESADRIVNKITIYIKVVRHSHTIVLNIISS